jgi:DNA-binding MarR family transcriptional regulator
MLREIYPKMNLEMAGVFLVICYHERVPLTQIAERLGLPQVTTHRHVSTLSKYHYKGDRFDAGFELVETEEDPTNRVRKIAFLTPKGKEVKERLLALLKDKELAEITPKKKK